MAREDVARVDSRSIAAWTRHDVEGVLEMLAETFVWTDVGLPKPMRSLDEVRGYVRGWIEAFPDLGVEQTNRVVDDNAVAGELVFTGTNNGPLGVAGTTPSADRTDGRRPRRVLRSVRGRQGGRVQRLPGPRRNDDATRPHAGDRLTVPSLGERRPPVSLGLSVPRRSG